MDPEDGVPLLCNFLSTADSPDGPATQQAPNSELVEPPQAATF